MVTSFGRPADARASNPTWGSVLSRFAHTPGCFVGWATGVSIQPKARQLSSWVRALFEDTLFEDTPFTRPVDFNRLAARLLPGTGQRSISAVGANLGRSCQPGRASALPGQHHEDGGALGGCVAEHPAEDATPVVVGIRPPRGPSQPRHYSG
jgi:hypothetical protein